MGVLHKKRFLWSIVTTVVHKMNRLQFVLHRTIPSRYVNLARLRVTYIIPGLKPVIIARYKIIESSRSRCCYCLSDEIYKKTPIRSRFNSVQWYAYECGMRVYVQVSEHEHTSLCVHIGAYV